MSGARVPTIGAAALQLIIGLTVFQANPKRRLNQCFLLLSLAIVAWLSSLHLAFTATTPIVGEFAIRETSAAGALCLMMFNLLRLSVLMGEQSWRDILGHARNRSRANLCDVRWAER